MKTKERHLGLHMPSDRGAHAQSLWLESISKLVETHIDLDAILLAAKRPSHEDVLRSTQVPSPFRGILQRTQPSSRCHSAFHPAC